MQFVLASGIDIGSRTSNTSTGAMQDLSNAALISAKQIVNSVQYYISLSKLYMVQIHGKHGSNVWKGLIHEGPQLLVNAVRKTCNLLLWIFYFPK